MPPATSDIKLLRLNMARPPCLIYRRFPPVQETLRTIIACRRRHAKAPLSGQRRHQAERIAALDPLALGRRNAKFGQRRDRDLWGPERIIGAEQQLRRS